MKLDRRRLLQGYYEKERLPKDFSPTRNVPDYAFNILNPQGLLYKPIVDIEDQEAGGTRPVWPGRRPFAVCLTHDVDAVTDYIYRQSARIRRSQFHAEIAWAKKTRILMGHGTDLLKSLRQIGRIDPLHCYEQWLRVESDIGAHSTFFFWPGLSNITRRHLSDCMYELTDRVIFDRQSCSVAEMIREIERRGWEIGLHSSWYSFDDADELKRQKDALEAVLEHPVLSVRQHCLHHDIRITPRIQAEAGFLYDSTLGFNDNIGFRFGTSYPWPLHDLSAERELPIMEIPLIIQDGAMLNPSKGMRLDENTAFEYCVLITREVKDVGGVLTLLWHPNRITQPDYWNLFKRILVHLKEQNALFLSIAELGAYWRTRSCPT